MVRVSLNRQVLEIAVVRRNISQNGLAQKLGISKSYLSLVVTGKREPSAAMRQRILDYLRDYTFDDLFVIEAGEDGDGSKAE